MLMNQALLQTDLGDLPLLARGKVRDIYATTPDARLRFDLRCDGPDLCLRSCSRARGIPDKGRILTQLSLFWFDFLQRDRAEPSSDRDPQRISEFAAAIFEPIGRSHHARQTSEDVPC